jgi:adenosylhomocysteine nucleosidase
VTFACATATEARVARKLGVRAARVGVCARRGLPEGPLVSFGVAGGLHDGVACGEVLDATRVVDSAGTVLWEGGPLGVTGARPATLLAADDVVDDPAERRLLHERTGADAVDMESGPLARSGRLVGCLRAVSDTPSRPLGPLAKTLGPDGRLELKGIASALCRPRETARALLGVRRALSELARSEGLSLGPVRSGQEAA